MLHIQYIIYNNIIEELDYLVQGIYSLLRVSCFVGIYIVHVDKNRSMTESSILSFIYFIINLLLTERESCTGEYWPEVVAVQTERSEVRTKTTEGQYSPVRLDLARLVSSLLYGTRTMLVLSLPAFENKKYTAYDRFHGNGPYGEIPTEKEPIRTLGFTLSYNNYLIFIYLFLLQASCYQGNNLRSKQKEQDERSCCKGSKVQVRQHM